MFLLFSFGLLGSSGCGKTTILNSVVGLVGFNSGTIELAVKSKKNMGFMPQVGLLREGVLLCEKSPQLLMEECNTQFLDDAFLSISQQQICENLENFRKVSLLRVDHKEVSTAIDFAKNNHLWGVLHFVQDFTDALSARIEEPFIKDTVVVENSSIIIFLDSSNKIIHGIIERKLRDSYLEMATDIYQACGYPTKFTDLPIKFEEPIYGNTNPNVKEFLAPGLISLLMFGMPLLYGYVIVEEKNLGATSRSLVAGTTVIEVLAAHLILRVGIQLLQTFCSMVIMYWILQFPLENPFYSTILIILQGLAGIATSFLLSTNLNSFLGISGVVTGSFTVTLFISGMLWPLEGMHPSIKLLSWIAPCTFSTQSLRSLSIRGWDLTNREVYLGFISSCLWMKEAQPSHSP
uniref:ABC transporter domain-containing protein n=1 Tax=Rhodnius prolixus TaxID=13249 RepID=T1HFL7_RHOPR